MSNVTQITFDREKRNRLSRWWVSVDGVEQYGTFIEAAYEYFPQALRGAKYMLTGYEVYIDGLLHGVFDVEGFSNNRAALKAAKGHMIKALTEQATEPTPEQTPEQATTTAGNLSYIKAVYELRGAEYILTGYDVYINGHLQGIYQIDEFTDERAALEAAKDYMLNALSLAATQQALGL